MKATYYCCDVDKNIEVEVISQPYSIINSHHSYDRTHGHVTNVYSETCVVCKDEYSNIIPDVAIKNIKVSNK